METLIRDMGFLDVFLGALYILVAYFWAFNVVSKNNTFLYKRYYLRGISYKIGGALFFAGIYVFYYKGGDSIAFFGTIKAVYNLFYLEPSLTFDFLTDPFENYPSAARYEAGSYGVQYLTRGIPSLTIIRIGFFLDLLCFNSYWALCVLFAVISYQFTWRFFVLLCDIYPRLHKEFALAVLFIPSVLFWGSGLAKDTVMFGSVLFFVYCTYKALILRKRVLYYITLLLITALLISFIRAFVLFTLIPCSLLMLTVHYRTSIQNSVARFVIGPALIVMGLAASYFIVIGIGSSTEAYNLESLEQKATGYRTWHTTQGGATYSLGGDPDDVSMGNLIRQAPLAITYSLFGPFLWQVSNPVMLLSAVESMFLLYLMLRLLLTSKLWRIYETVISEPLVAFALPFVIIMAIAIGLTSFNFGALVRYRIPILPFFLIMLVIINYRIGFNVASKKG